MENYTNLNGVWTPVLIVPAGTTVTDGIIESGDMHYSVAPLKSDGKTAMYIIRGKTRLALPDGAKQQITDLQTANASLGKQVGQLTLANASLGKQVAALSIQIAKGGNS